MWPSSARPPADELLPKIQQLAATRSYVPQMFGHHGRVNDRVIAKPRLILMGGRQEGA